MDPSRPRRAKIRMALLGSNRPAPTSLSSAARSKSWAAMPRRASAMARVSPPMPAPMMPIRRTVSSPPYRQCFQPARAGLFLPREALRGDGQFKPGKALEELADRDAPFHARQLRAQAEMNS